MERVSNYLFTFYPVYPLTLLRWMFILFPAPGAGVDFSPTPEEYHDCIKKMVGNATIPIEILSVSKWFINEIVAEYYSNGNM